MRLLYAPRDGRVRDEDNLAATLKPLCDGWSTRAWCPMTVPPLISKPSPRSAPQRPSTLWLVVRELIPTVVETLYRGLADPVGKVIEALLRNDLILGPGPPS